VLLALLKARSSLVSHFKGFIGLCLNLLVLLGFGHYSSFYLLFSSNRGLDLMDSWSPPLDEGLTEWESFCHDLDSMDDQALEDHSSLHATLRSMARLLARNQRSQALHGKATSLLARKVISCMQGTEAETLAKTVQV